MRICIFFLLSILFMPGCVAAERAQRQSDRGLVIAARTADRVERVRRSFPENFCVLVKHTARGVDSLYVQGPQGEAMVPYHQSFEVCMRGTDRPSTATVVIVGVRHSNGFREEIMAQNGRPLEIRVTRDHRARRPHAGDPYIPVFTTSQAGELRLATRSLNPRF
jgi:hypothetical protein